jgi:D-alanyl-D-alanine carboxypeptidase (penicillin-binding protein 5/6)
MMMRLLPKITASLSLFAILAATCLNSNAATPSPPKLATTAYILVDYDSNHTIAELNSDNRVEPASLTKMMSSYVLDHELANGNIRLTDEVRISKKAWKMPGSRMFVEVNTRVTVEALMKGIIIQSGNDATVAMAEHIAGSEEAFASLMNSHAKELGMHNTNFVNSTGLPHKDHYTTARDLAILSRAIIKDFPEHYPLYAEKEYTYNNIRQYNRNKLLWQDKFVDGLKTGHTESAGYCLAASAKRGDMRLISIVLGTKSESARATESQKLLTYGFRFFETHKLYSAGAELTKTRIWKGESETLPLGLAEDMYVTIPRGQYKKLKANMTIDKKIIAPATQGKSYGKVNLNLSGEIVTQRPLVALTTVNKGSLAGGLMDEMKLLFE